MFIPTYCRVSRVGNTEDIQTATAGETRQTPKTITNLTISDLRLTTSKYSSIYITNVRPPPPCREKSVDALAQHRTSSVVLYRRRQLDLWPNVALPPSDTRWRAWHHRSRPSFPLGTKPRGTMKSFPWGTKPWGRKKTFTRWRARQHRRRPSFPWGTKPQGTTKSFPWGTKPRGRSFSWGTKPWGQKKSFPWGKKPQGQQQQQKRNDKDDAQPPRLRRTKQASPQNLFLCFHKTPPPF